MATTSRNAQLLLLSIKCTTARLLRLALALLPLLLSFLVPLSSLLNAASTFLLVNLLVLAIVYLSSASSSPRPSPDHNNPIASPSTSPSRSLYTSSSYCPDPSPDSMSRSLPEEVSIQRSNVGKETTTSQSAAAASKLSAGSCPLDDEFKSRAILPASAFVPVSSQGTIVKSPSPTQVLQDLGAAVAVSDRQMNQLAITERPSKEQLKKQPAIKWPAQQKQFAASSLVSTGDLMVRSRSDQRICAGESTKSCTKTLRRIETLESAVDLRTGCDSKSSSMIVILAPSFESLVDDDLSKRCEKFIADNYEKWKQESLVCTN